MLLFDEVQEGIAEENLSFICDSWANSRVIISSPGLVHDHDLLEPALASDGATSLPACV